MAFDGNGNFIRLYNWVSDKNSAVDITASKFDAEDSGFAAGLTLCVTRDGQGKMAANLLSIADATYDIGSASFRWNNGWYSGNVTVGGTVAAGALTVGGNPARTILTAAKTGNSTITNQTAFVNDPQLQIALPSGGNYAFEAFLLFDTNSGGTQGFRYNVSYGSTTSVFDFALVTSVATTVNSNAQAQVFATCGAGLKSNFLQLCGRITTTGAGTLIMQYAQASGGAATTTVYQASYMKLTQLS